MFFFNFSFFLLIITPYIISHNALFHTLVYLRYNPIKKEIPTIKDQDSIIIIQSTFWLNIRKNISTLEQNSIYKNASMTKFYNHFYPSTNTNKISYSNLLSISFNRFLTEFVFKDELMTLLNVEHFKMPFFAMVSNWCESQCSESAKRP